TRLAEQPLLAGLKHLNRLEQVLARAEWQDPQYAEGLVLDRAGRVIEGVFSNLFLVHDGVLGTPSVERCGVAGVMRAELLANAERMGVAWQVRDYSLDELYQADEIFLCNSLYGVWPVCRLEQRDWPLGPLTRKRRATASGLVDGWSVIRKVFLLVLLGLLLAAIALGVGFWLQRQALQQPLQLEQELFLDVLPGATPSGLLN